MRLVLSISPHGTPFLDEADEEALPALSAVGADRLRAAFADRPAAGLLHLATAELRTALPASLAFARDFAQRYLIRLCHTPDLEKARDVQPIRPDAAELTTLAEQAPPMKGLEYLNAETLAAWWTDLDEHVRQEIAQSAGGAAAYLREKNPLWRLVGRVTFHLAENKRDEQRPFAFLATYTHRLSSHGEVQHLALSRALSEYAGARNREVLLALLSPIQQAAERCKWIQELVETGAVYQPLAWTPAEAFRFLKDVPAMEQSGLVVRVPDWWKATRPSRPQVSVRIGEASGARVGADALLDFSVGVTLQGQDVSEVELRELLSSAGGLVRLRGKWVEVDRDKLNAALQHWKQVEREARGGGITFFEGMRLLAGVDVEPSADASAAEQVREWTGIAPGQWLGQTLAELRDPARLAAVVPRGLKAELRPYQQVGVNWLRFMTRIGLGACLADDMGLGKTIQVLSLLLHAKESAGTHTLPTSLLIVPASLIANWKSEINRFAPALSVCVAHPSEAAGGLADDPTAIASLIAGRDLCITTYGMLARIKSLREQKWNLAILDEAQAIRNAGTRQARAVKELKAAGRIALTGTPIENRLSDLWSLFDFLNPGLLGSAKAFARFTKAMERAEEPSFAPLRSLVKPYILRRLKTDKRIIADLPEKTEIKAYCGLSKQQAALYQRCVEELGEQLGKSDGIQRKGLVLAALMRFKQICNHPSQWLADSAYDPDTSGKFQRLRQLCEELATRQEKALIFTQFREITAPLAAFLEGVFGRQGLVLHGGVAVGRRREMVEAFQRDNGPPFFVLSLKAGGTGLNLTAASQVIHFDRWWNPAVENQATDRTFRIGQQRNVFVHKFVCRGTVEERIDQMISDKSGLSRDLLEGGAERMLTEMSDQELLRFVALDVTKTIGD